MWSRLVSKCAHSAARAKPSKRSTQSGGEFRLVHDTFHHFLAGEDTIFPELTGLVHISGVEDPRVTVSDMRDPHRVLVGPADRIGNIEQVRALGAGGYRGLFSFEPFAEELRTLRDPRPRSGTA